MAMCSLWNTGYNCNGTMQTWNTPVWDSAALNPTQFKEYVCRFCNSCHTHALLVPSHFTDSTGSQCKWVQCPSSQQLSMHDDNKFESSTTYISCNDFHMKKKYKLFLHNLHQIQCSGLATNHMIDVDPQISSFPAILMTQCHSRLCLVTMLKQD